MKKLQEHLALMLPQPLLGLWEAQTCLRVKGSLSLELHGWRRSSYKYLTEDRC